MRRSYRIGCNAGLTNRRRFVHADTLHSSIDGREEGVSERLDLHLLETVLPQSRVGGDTVLAEVDEDVPVR